MKVSQDTRKLIEKIKQGKLDYLARELNNSDFGVFIPATVKDGKVTTLERGQSQSENDLVVTITTDQNNLPEDAQQVGWVGRRDGKDKVCDHPKGFSCTHCTKHGGSTITCTKHNKMNLEFDLTESFPVLDYEEALKDFKEKEHLLDRLAKEGFGLSLLHGHSDEHRFTKLPPGNVSVISSSKTTFRTEDDVEADETFVPNIWRFIDGKVRVTGGFSKK